MTQNCFSPELDRLIRLPEVIGLTGRCRSSIYEDMKHGRFPQSVKIGPRSVAWLQSDLKVWQNNLN
jgi:prophage regulatory protein